VVAALKHSLLDRVADVARPRHEPRLAGMQPTCISPATDGPN
jgi:hypothetical protein